MKVAKIVVKNKYEKRGDLVLRSYVRALNKIHEGRLLDGENALVYGLVNDHGVFYEIFTNEIIDYDGYKYVTVDEIFDVAMMEDHRVDLLRKIIRKVLFRENIELDFEVSTIEELAKDRAVEFDAYDNGVSRINPYQRLNESNPLAFNDYNNFLRKIEEVKMMKKMDNMDVETIDEYEVLENPRQYVKKIV